MRPDEICIKQTKFSLCLLLFSLWCGVSRGLHQELQCPVQRPAEAPGGRGQRDGVERGSRTLGHAPALAAAPPHYRADHFLFPALRHGSRKGTSRWILNIKHHLTAGDVLKASPLVGRRAHLLHPVVRLLLRSQPHLHPAGQAPTGTPHRRRGQVQSSHACSALDL